MYFKIPNLLYLATESNAEKENWMQVHEGEQQRLDLGTEKQL